MPHAIFLGTGCIDHPHGWNPYCSQCRYVLDAVVKYTKAHGWTQKPAAA